MAGNTNATFILTIFAFYGCMAVIFGLIGNDQIQATLIGTPPTPTFLGFLSEIGYFISGIFFVIGELPVWANIVLFAPLGITLLYIVLSFFRGSS